MIRSLLNNSSDFTSILISMLLSLPVILFALSVHETAHGYVAYKMGDPTARNLGRLTLNPIKHIDPIGFICMIFAGFGWAKPVPVNARNFKKPRWGMALTGAAGPISNLLLAVINVACYKLVYEFLLVPFGDGRFAVQLNFLAIFLLIGAQLNTTLAVFNLLPIPPFDGSRIFYVFLPPKLYFGVMKYERVIMLVMMILLIFGFVTPIISTVTDFILNGMFFIFGL